MNTSNDTVTIAFRIPSEMAQIFDVLIDQRQRQLGRFAKKLTRSDVARELLELGLQALETPEDA